MNRALVLASGVLMAASLSASADVLLGWESWGGADDVWETTLAAPGFSGLAEGTPETGGVWFNHNNSGWNFGASDDGTFGTLASPAADATVALGEGISLANGYDGFIDFTITNNTADAYTLTGFHFDSGASRPRAAKNWDLSVVAGTGITVGSPNSGTTTEALAPITDDWDVSLSGQLAPAASVTLRLNWTGGGAPETGSSGHNTMLDNVAISGTVIPEPSTLGLVAFVGGLLLVRCRRS